MRKMMCLLLSVILCLSLAVSGAAAAFTPSVSYKDTPEIVAVRDEKEQEVVAVIRQDSGDFVSFVEVGDLVVTSVMDAKSEDGHTTEAEKVLVEVYEALSDGSMEIPYEKLDDVNADEMVVRDLFEVSFTENASGENYTEVTKPDGVFLEITFQLGVPADVKVYAMTYNDGQWDPIRETRNNGDGTVTCLFEHLCPVAFCVEQSAVEAPAAPAVDQSQNESTSQEGRSGVALWAGLAAVSAAVLAAVVAGRKKRGNQK